MKNPDWSPEDDARLRAFHATELNAEQIAAHFAGRTCNGVKGRMRKLKLGVREMAYAKWTPAEYALLRKIWFEKGTLKQLCAEHFPARGWRSVMEHGLASGLPRRTKQRGCSYSWVTEELIRVLAAQPNLTVPEIAARCAGSRQRVTTLLRQGHGIHFFKSGWERVRVTGNGGWWPRWSLGAGPDAPMPVATSNSVNGKQHRFRRRVLAGKIDPFSTIRQQIAA
ncbi:hypothetical protein G3N59_01240 [Paraburkholderia sp. Ac-20340]|uniref:SANT/Myb-like DNA-binding domain-containing protein n=1 Tax=Paraburkholderia sp. Ac-20340 TaxID=2703888 RepID=UPI00198220BD|nr:hypothetical protein [Paraburkholderia sp. Ac-20340]MBN3851992.1 hypothetical protein [Paraburkholderia sp. Ac-20340]